MRSIILGQDSGAFEMQNLCVYVCMSVCLSVCLSFYETHPFIHSCDLAIPCQHAVLPNYAVISC